MDWAIWVLWTSSLLNAAYFLPILWRAWLRPVPTTWPEEHIARRGWRETTLLLLLPPLLLLPLQRLPHLLHLLHLLALLVP